MKFKDKVVYQIYPKSFCDSNHDGFGDIKGITSKLDYLKELGVDYLWVTPFFVSPQNDNGYDVADYYTIDPKFGTMSDVEELIHEAGIRNIGLMFDMVFNHTSIYHEWFQKALTGDPYYKDFYFFKKNEGHLPNNWESKFGGPPWEYVPEFDEYYLHLFDKTQADLNWSNPNVRNELVKILNFWMDKGIKGFRFDVVNLISKDSFENDLDGIGKKFYTDGKNVHKYLHELNQKTFGRFNDMVTVGEMSATTIEKCADYTNPTHHELDMTFNFHHLKVDYKNKEKWTNIPFDFMELKELFNTWQVEMQQKNGWNALFWNCHDQPRSLSRFGNDKTYRKESAKMLATAIHMMQGTPYIYQGEEIGMTNHYFHDIEQYRDVESINAYHILKKEGYKEEEIHSILQAKSRDNARTPMQWDTSVYSGFSDTEPWIQVNTNYPEVNVANDLKDANSIFRYYQKLIQLRKQYSVISKGAYIPLFIEHNSVLAYKRVYQREELIVLNNFYEKEVTLNLEDIEQYDVLLSNYTQNIISDNIKLKAYETIVLYKKMEQ